MKIFKTSDIRKIDEYTISHEPVTSVDLMERAASSVFNWFINRYDKSQHVYIFCGNGNNGGDGLALSRMLTVAGFNTSVYILKDTESFSPDAKVNYIRLKELSNAKIEFLSDNLPDIKADSIVVDALLGSGLNRPLDGYNTQLVQHINQCACPIISIDTPSGLFGEDNSMNKRNAIIKATHTLSFEMPKLAFLLPENELQTGDWHILPIGLHPEALNNFLSDFYYTTKPVNPHKTAIIFL